MLTAVITAALTDGLVDAVKSMVYKPFIDPLLEPLFKDVRKWLFSGRDKRLEEREVYEIFTATLKEATDNLSPESRAARDQKSLLFDLRIKDPHVYHEIAALAIVMVDPAASDIPRNLRDVLRFDTEFEREFLAQVIARFRANLAKSTDPGLDGLRKAIAYADALESRDLLKDVKNELSEIKQTIKEYLRARVKFPPSDEEALADYLRYARRQWSILRLPITQAGISLGNRSPLLHDMFVPLQLQPQAAGDESGSARTIVRIGDLLNRQPRSILLGPPGCGKTTLLHHLALAFSEGHGRKDLGWDGEPLFPILLPLRVLNAYLANNPHTFAAPNPRAVIQALNTYIEEGYLIQLSEEFFVRRLQEGHCLVIFDGLDEAAENIAQVAEFIKAFIETFGSSSGNIFLLSSRPDGYDLRVRNILSGTGLEAVSVLPLDKSAREQLIRNLLDFLEGDLVRRGMLRTGLIRSIGASKEMAEIASIPLFCSALVQVYLYYNASLPERRVEVLDTIVVLLLGHWRTIAIGNIPANYAVDIKRMRLAFIANIMQEGHRLEIGTRDLLRELARYIREDEGRIPDPTQAHGEAENFLQDSTLNSGLLMEAEAGKYAFLHKLFMEYFAASWLVENELAAEKAIEHAGDPWWEPVLVLTASHPKTSGAARKRMIDSLVNPVSSPDAGAKAAARALLAGKALVDIKGNMPQLHVQKVQDLLQGMTCDDTQSARDRAAAGSLLGKIGDPRADLTNVDEMRFCLVSAGPFYPGEGEGEQAQDLPEFYMARYPVSNAQFAAFVESGAYSDSRWWRGLTMPRGSWTNRQGFLGFTGFPPDWRERQAAQLAEFPTHPVVNISWYEACAFTLWLEKRWSETEWWPHGWKVSLPSQEEWEKAARGGLKTNLPRILAPNQILGSLGPAAEPIEFLANPAPRRIYPCNALPNPEEINFADTGLRGTSALGCFDSNDALYGIQDLAGNAFEWTVSHWPNTPSMYVVKGGSFHSQASHTRIGFNFRYEAIRANEFCGFRCLIRRP